MHDDTKKFIKALCVCEPILGKVYPVISVTLLYTFAFGGFFWLFAKSLFQNSFWWYTVCFFSVLLAYNLLAHSILYHIHRKVVNTALYRYRLHYLILLSFSMFFPFACYTVATLNIAKHFLSTDVWYYHGVATILVLKLFTSDFVRTQEKNFKAYLKRPINIDKIMFQGRLVTIMNIVGTILTPYAFILLYKGITVDSTYQILLIALLMNLATIVMLYIFLTSFYVLRVVLPKVEKQTGLPAVINVKIYK